MSFLLLSTHDFSVSPSRAFFKIFSFYAIDHLQNKFYGVARLFLTSLHCHILLNFNIVNIDIFIVFYIWISMFYKK